MIVSIAFLAVFVVCAVVFDGEPPWSLASDLAALLTGGVATAIAIALRRDVFEVEVVRAARQQRKTALRIVCEDPAEALRLGIGQIDVPDDGRFPDGGLIDLNNASMTALRRHIGLGEETAARLIAIRNSVGGFESLADVCQMVDLAPQVFDSAKNRAIFLPPVAHHVMRE